MRRIRTLLAALAVFACGACVSIGVAVALFMRAHEVEPIRNIDAVLVTYPQGGHPSIEIVEPATLEMFKDMLNSEREGWRHPLLGEMPVPVAVLVLMDGNRRSSVRIGVESLERDNLVKNVSESRVSELLTLASGAPEGGTCPAVGSVDVPKDVAQSWASARVTASWCDRVLPWGRPSVAAHECGRVGIIVVGPSRYSDGNGYDAYWYDRDQDAIVGAKLGVATGRVQCAGKFPPIGSQSCKTVDTSDCPRK